MDTRQNRATLSPSPFMRLLPLFVASSLLTLAGCATYPVQVVASRDSKPDTSSSQVAQTYYLDPAEYASLTQSPQFEQALVALKNALAQRGFTQVGRRDAATVVIGFSYAATLAGVDRWYSSESRDVVSRTDTKPHGSQTPANPNPRYTKETTLQSRRESRYHIAMRIDARDAKTDKDAWRVETSAIIGPHDRNNILPVMMAAAAPFLDPAASSATTVPVNQSSADVRALRKGS